MIYAKADSVILLLIVFASAGLGYGFGLSAKSPLDQALVFMKGRCQLIPKVAMTSLIASCMLASSQPCFGATGYDADLVRLKSCEPNTNCVSSSYNEPPNRYLSPLRVVNDRDEAFRRAIRDITAAADGNTDLRVVEVLPKDYYIHLTVPGTAPASLDDVELLFGDGIVNLRCEARITLPPPPFCVKKNCINGNMDQRERTDKIARLLGLPPADQAQMQKGAKWTPIFFNSDRVPDFLDDLEYE